MLTPETLLDKAQRALATAEQLEQQARDLDTQLLGLLNSPEAWNATTLQRQVCRQAAQHCRDSYEQHIAAATRLLVA